ncbi:MAG: hypothetical protein IT361_16680 [Gemmatimonadaceae bacterium]|nr:hypothetical protein [Gemmatimonadaceae bacterium]
MFIRGPHPESVIWPHFRSGWEGFVFGARDGVFEAQLVPNADRTIELLLALVEHLTPAVDVRLDDWRTDRAWRGTSLENSDVRDAIARSKQAWATYAGAEVTMIGGGEQVTLTANLELFVFAPSDRWLYLLQGKGLRRLQRLRKRSWSLTRGEFRPSVGAESAVRLTVERLRLEPEAAGAPD